MIGKLGEDVILSKSVLTSDTLIPSKSVGRLSDIEGRFAKVFFEGRGNVRVPLSSIRQKNFASGDRVHIVGKAPSPEIAYLGVGVVTACWVNSSLNYTYRVKFSTSELSLESQYLRHIPESESPMNISELAKHMIDVGGGVNPSSVPEWFRSTVNIMKDLPQLSQMGHAQMEFVIRRHLENRNISFVSDIVTNVLFGIQSSTTMPDIRKIERELYTYKEKLDIEWKKLNMVVPIEFQYAALKAFSETK